MKKLLCALLALALCAALGACALAETRLADYALYVDGEEIPLDKESGVLAKEDGKLAVPVAALLNALGIAYEQNGEKTQMRIERADGAAVELKKGYAAARVDGKKKKLGFKTYWQSEGVLMADVEILDHLDVSYRLVKAGAQAEASGLSNGALLVGGNGPSPEAALEQSAAADLPAAEEAEQIVLVDYQGGIKAVVSLHEKVDGAWTETLSANGYVGANGIDKAKEGDKRTPTGTFNLTQAFGILDDPGSKLPYVKVTKHHYWCGTSASKYYNQLLDVRKVDYEPSKADEHLIDYGKAYHYGVFIDYNVEGEPGKGSCIFLHCSTGGATAGCVSVPEAQMKELLLALKPGAKIVIR